MEYALVEGSIHGLVFMNAGLTQLSSSTWPFQHLLAKAMHTHAHTVQTHTVHTHSTLTVASHGLFAYQENPTPIFAFEITVGQVSNARVRNSSLPCLCVLVSLSTSVFIRYHPVILSPSLYSTML